MKYTIFSQAGPIDTAEAPAGYTIEKYLGECRANGCQYEDESGLYIVATEAQQTAERILQIDPREAMDTGTDRAAILETMDKDPLIIINYLLDIIDELQE